MSVCPVNRTSRSGGAELLQSSGDSVAEIASAVGYDSEAAFNRAFKREFTSPAALFRRNANTIRFRSLKRVVASALPETPVRGFRRSAWLQPGISSSLWTRLFFSWSAAACRRFSYWLSRYSNMATPSRLLVFSQDRPDGRLISLIA
jgi:hypothetical protein